jgi:hypothetical protein
MINIAVTDRGRARDRPSSVADEERVRTAQSDESTIRGEARTSSRD